MADCESAQMIIHQKKATKDSRNSSLIVSMWPWNILYRSRCSASPYKCSYPILQQDVVKQTAGLYNLRFFVWIPFKFGCWWKYLEFICSKQKWWQPCLQRTGYWNSKKDFLQRLQDLHSFTGIWCHKSLGCDLCPKQLESNTGKSEEEFKDRKCHISDGINEIEGYTGKDIFEEEIGSKYLVKGIDAKQRTFLNQIKHRQFLQELSKTPMKASDANCWYLSLASVHLSA